MKASDIRRGTVIIHEGNPCRVMEFQHRTPGNLRAFVQVRMRNLNTGNSFETRFSSTELLQEARLDTKELQVLYKDVNGTHVMDAATYDQYTIDEEATGELTEYICQENNRYLNRLEDDLGQPIFGPRPQPGQKPSSGTR